MSKPESKAENVMNAVAVETRITTKFAARYHTAVLPAGFVEVYDEDMLDHHFWLPA